MFRKSAVTALGIFLAGATVVVLSNATYFESRFSMMERGLACLSIALIYKFIAGANKQIYIPTTLLVLTLASGISIINYLQIYRIEDLIGYAAAFLTATIYVSLFDATLLINSISAGFAALVCWSLLLLNNGEVSWNQYGQYQGPFVHYNILGFTMLLALPCFLFIKTSKVLTTLFLRMSLLPAAGYLIFISESRTSQISAIAVLVSYVIWFAFMKNKIYGWILILACSIFSIAVFINSSAILSLLGKDDSLSGRTKIWESLISHIWDKPITGFGWSRLFTPDSPVSAIASSETGFFVSHSHNDLLHWYITTGLIGAVLVILNLVVIIYLVRSPISKKQSWAAWALISTLALIFSGITEISSFQVQGWFVLSLVSTMVIKEYLNSKSRANSIVGLRLSSANYL